MGIKEGALALADELEAFEDGDCEECIAYGQPECKGHLSCAEIIARYSARKVREAVERDAEDVTTVSAYDLLGDDDREALAWVREHGGLDMVASRFESGEIAADMLWGKGHGRFWTSDEFEEEISKRLMPAGCEWPRFEDGEQVRIGDEFAERIYGNPCRVGHFAINKHAFLIFDEEDLNDCEAIDHGSHMRVKRPEHTVLAADGEPLEVGQTVWHVGNGVEFTVIGLPNPGEYQSVKLRLDDGAFTGFDPDRLTHQRPVLDADGVPIKVGDTVWDIETGCRRTVRAVNDNGTVEFDGHENRGWFGKFLTHAKPEPPDSRRAIVNEIGDEMAARIDLLVSSGRWSDAD